ncbi:MAG: V-type ATP synthase subunit D [Candidatus Parvarchaeota archaeon]|nr:V-type ATP synthase subunit D [Candidatus Parvarchaeota archaeon]MCW1295600.1 V-type ATP synthase subunit D [Candidatus Parvarchaeum tengchongense]MCW1312607.1 V-type ATP synthase subunit D [Candidatus Parvarchaeum tengchongense]
METIRVTRRELIETKRRIKTANRGLQLLKMKRSSLILEFFELAKQVQSMKTDLKRFMDRSRESLEIAEALSGRITIERVAQEQSEKLASLKARNVMGLVIPNINVNETIDVLSKSDSLTIPTPVYDAKNMYSSFLSMLIEIAEKETAMRNLLNEIYKLNRRTNSIENVIIPRWEAKIKYIKQSLDDMERDRLVSIKFIKRLHS